jgi:hypothetical protein
MVIISSIVSTQSTFLCAMAKFKQGEGDLSALNSKYLQPSLNICLTPYTIPHTGYNFIYGILICFLAEARMVSMVNFLNRGRSICGK